MFWLIFLSVFAEGTRFEMLLSLDLNWYNFFFTLYHKIDFSRVALVQ